MGVVVLAAPGPVFLDPNQQAVHSNATLTASGSSILSGYGVKEISLFINIKAAPTGTLPTLQFTLQEVDPGDGTTVIGSVVTSTVISAIGIQRLTLLSAFGGNIKVSWTVGGSSPSFTQVYATLVGKTGSTAIVDATGANAATVKAASTAAAETDPALVVAVSPNNTVANQDEALYSLMCDVRDTLRRIELHLAAMSDENINEGDVST